MNSFDCRVCLLSRKSLVGKRKISLVDRPPHHYVCRTLRFNFQLNLSLLRTCSQVYMEAALIQLIHNLNLADASFLPRFTANLVSLQTAAITSLALNIFMFDLFDEAY
jgi:hypothetical protein